MAPPAHAALFVFQSTLNPFGIFTQKSLLVPRIGVATVISAAYSLFSTLFLAMFFIAVRRQFKMSLRSIG
jgi:hypothetical protein